MKISIFGLGYVGSVSAACLANEGHAIIAVDVNENKVKMLNEGLSLIVESQLAELTQRAVQQKSLRATLDSEDAILNSDLSFICVGTPSNKNNSLDLQYVEKVTAEIGRALKNKSDFHIVIYRSTMFPGTIRNTVIPILEKYSAKKEGADFQVCLNPEFMMEATAVYDFYHPPKNIIGTINGVGCDKLVALNDSYTKMKTIILPVETAEFIKYCDNIWHALKVGFANEIGNMCKVLNIDSHTVMDVFCEDTKLNLSPYYLKPGFAFGGSCLPKDLRAFLYESQNLNLQLPIISAVLPSNHLQIQHALNMIIEQQRKRIGILGFSFKANTDDVRESPMIELIERLIGKGYDLTLYDSNVQHAKLHGANRDYLLNHIPHISELMVLSIAEVLDHSEVIVIGNKAEEFKSILTSLRVDHVIIDLVRIFDKLPNTKQYQGICW